VYSLQWNCTLHDNLRISTFNRPWHRMVDRHPALRTAFSWELRDEPFQIVYRHVDPSWRQHDWRRMAADEQERQLEASSQTIQPRGMTYPKPR
jgi:hypothetical protein